MRRNRYEPADCTARTDRIAGREIKNRVAGAPATPSTFISFRSAPPMPEERCYLCDGMVKRDDEIVRVHEATMHRRCFEEDIRRGR